MKLFLWISVFFFCDVAAGDVQFWKEAIDVTIKVPDTVQVSGKYYLKARAVGDTIKTVIFYPFPVDSTLDYPYWYEAAIGTNTPAPHVCKARDGITLEVTVLPQKVCTLTVVYKQHVRQRKGRYILTTTQYWGEPLAAGDYSVEVPSGITLEYLSYPSDTIEDINQATIFRFQRRAFLPDRDLIFSWK